MKITRGLIFVSVGIGLVAACGGSTSTPGGGNDAGPGGSGSSSSGSGSGGSGSSGSSGGSSSGAGSSGSSGGSSSGAVSIIPPGATPGAGMVTCGAATCNAPDVCCSGGGGGVMCSSIASCNSAGNDSYTCTGQPNCTAPLICCVTFGMRGTNDVSACQAACGGQNTAQVCRTDAECPTGNVCRSGGAGGGINICQPPLIPPGATAGTGAVTCGGATCNAPNVCCAGGGGGGGGGLMCSALNACDGAGNDSYTCTGRANCTAPMNCCVLFGMGGSNDVSVCQATCPGANTQVCQTDAECPTGLVCRGGGGVAQGITVCRQPAMMRPDAGTTTPDASTPTVDAAIDNAAPPPDAGARDTGTGGDAAVDAPSGG